MSNVTHLYSVQILDSLKQVIFKQNFTTFDAALDLYCQLDGSLDHDNSTVVLIH